jgi:hypothetical protein
MAKQKKTIEVVEKTTEVAAQQAPKATTTKHKIIRQGLGHKVGDVVQLGVKGVEFYKSKNLIK